MPHPSKDTIAWAYRLFLDREAESETVLNSTFSSTAALRETFLGSLEYRLKNPGGQLSLDKWVIKETIHGFRIWVSLGELGVSRPILNDLYESAEVAVVKQWIKPGDTVLDIGTNIGFYSLLFCTLVGDTGKVIGFEPLSFLCQKARLSVEENRFSSICTIHNAAVADQNGTLSIRHAPQTTNFGGGHIAPHGAPPAHHVDELVQVVRIDDQLPSTRVSFIKIDVEGAEPMALAGAKHLLQRDRPVIIAELHNRQLSKIGGSSASQLINQLAAIGYACHAIEDRDLTQSIESYEGDRVINVLFVPKR